MLLETSESREFVADFYDTVFIWLEKETDVTIVHHRYIFVFSNFLRGQPYMRIYPGLSSLSAFEALKVCKDVMTHFRATLIVQVYQNWTPGPSSKNNFVGVVLGPICGLNTNARLSVLSKERFFERSCSVHHFRACLNRFAQLTYPPTPKLTP